jgi:poly(A) polymerase
MALPSPVRTTQHNISLADIDDDAYRVIRRLHQCGFEAFLVGGSVRDLLLGKRPKDFDIVTGARPNDVRRIFRNCRLIGRRFRLAHLLFANGKVLECATFRAEPFGGEDGEAVLITDDNEFGTPETDARRRDFTVNALFYDPQTAEVIDWVGGLKDLDARVLRTIGEPVTRFREDPVRMLRAVKFAARVGFHIDEPGRAAIRQERKQLKKAAIPRLYEEILRMLWGGAAARSFELMDELGLLEILLPEVSAWLSRGSRDPAETLRALLATVDAKFQGRQQIENGVLLSTLFWPIFQDLMHDRPRAVDSSGARKLAEELVGPAAIRLRMPRKDVGILIACLEQQLRIAQAGPKRTARIQVARHAAFPDALDLLALRTEAEGLDEDALAEWESLRDVPRHAEPDEESFTGGRGRGGGGRRRRR